MCLLCVPIRTKGSVVRNLVNCMYCELTLPQLGAAFNCKVPGLDSLIKVDLKKPLLTGELSSFFRRGDHVH
jgi:hypothetical protein